MEFDNRKKNDSGSYEAWSFKHFSNHINVNTTLIMEAENQLMNYKGLIIQSVDKLYLYTTKTRKSIYRKLESRWRRWKEEMSIHLPRDNNFFENGEKMTMTEKSLGVC